jgi:small subunit ribosomal protein S17
MMSDTSTTTSKQAGKQADGAGQGELAGARIGVVNSDKCDKTRKVVIEYKAMHPKYGKYVSRRTVLHVHDENNESNAGDTVEVFPCRPISKSKCWKLARVVERAVGSEA